MAMDVPKQTARARRSRRNASWGKSLVLWALLPTGLGCGGLQHWWHNGGLVGPNYGTPSAEVAEAWIDADSPQLKSAPVDPVAWWTVFGDPVLNHLVQHASQQNLSLRAACQRILEARAERGVAAGSLFAQQQEMTGTYSRNGFSRNAYPFGSFPIKMDYDDWQVGFDAAWELDFWGRFRRAVEAADAHLDAQCAAYDEVLVMLQAEVAASYIQMRAMEERLQLARQNVELQRKTLQLADTRFRGGMVSELDTQQSKAILAVTEALIPSLEAARRRFQNRLCVLLAVPPHDMSDEIAPSRGIPAAPAEVAVGIPAELLRRRPDVRRAEREAAALSARIGIAEAEFYPHIAITGTIGIESQYLSDLFHGDSLMGRVGPGFKWNLLNYGRIANNVRAAEARFCQAVLNYRDTVLKANEEVENALAAFLQERLRVQALNEATAALARAVELATHQYQQGVIDFQPLLDSQRGLVQQQDLATESRAQASIHLVAVYKALGGGWQARLGLPEPEGVEMLPPPLDEARPLRATTETTSGLPQDSDPPRPAPVRQPD